MKDTLRSFQEVLDGKHDDLPEAAFYMVSPPFWPLIVALKLIFLQVGNIEAARAKGEKILAELEDN